MDGKAANALMIILLTFLSLLTPACVMAYLLDFLLTVPELFDGSLFALFKDLKSSYVARVLTCICTHGGSLNSENFSTNFFT